MRFPTSSVQHDGDVVVIGDVAEDGVVKASGDIVVVGRLSGEVHAGKDGDRSATVLAVRMEPSQIQIADAIAVGDRSQGAEGAMPYPEIARVDADALSNALRIRIEPAGSVRRRAGVVGRQQAASASWSPPARSARLTGIYLIIAGCAIMAAPLSIFGTFFDVRAITRGWIQVFGVIATALGLYYVGAAAGDAGGAGVRGVYAATVAGRIFICVAFCYLVARYAIDRSLLLLAVLNLVSAIGMYSALQ